MYYSPEALKQDLNRVMSLVKPERSTLDLFLVNLVHFLRQLDEEASEEKIQLHLQEWVTGTLLSINYAEPESYSSPVCYASVSGLREEFDTEDLFKNNACSAGYSPKGSSYLNPENRDFDLQKALQITRLWVGEVLRTWQEKQLVTHPDLTKQVEQLIYQFYGLQQIT